MTRDNVKKIMGIVAAALLVIIIVVAAIPACRNAVLGLFASEDTPAGTEAPVDTDDDADGNTDADADGNTDTDADDDDAADAEITRPLSFEDFIELALDDGMWNVAPQGATIHDLTNDEFVAESDAEKAELFAVSVRVNPYGAMTINQKGFEHKLNHDGEAVAPALQLCNCDKKHGAWDDDFGQFHWNAAEGNEALGPKSWTRMYGEMTEVLFDIEAREILRASACYWYTVDAEGAEQIVYGIRVCGDQRDPEAPKPEDTDKPQDTPPADAPAEKPADPTPGNTPEHTDKEEVVTYTVTYKFVGKNGQRLPAAVLNLLPTAEKAEKGEMVQPKNVAVTTIKVADGTWYFDGWDKTQVTVNGNVAFTGTWRFRENLGLADHPIANNQDELDQLGDRTDEVPEDSNVPQHSPRPSTGSNVSSDNRDKGGLTLAPTLNTDDGNENAERPALGLAPVAGQAANNNTPVDDSEIADQATQDALNALFGPRT